MVNPHEEGELTGAGEQAGPLTATVFERAGWHRLDLRTSWGTAVGLGAARLPELIIALQRLERDARKQGVVDTLGDAGRGSAA